MNRRDMIRNTLLSAGAMTARGAVSQDAMPPQPHKRSFPSPTRQVGGERMPNILWVCTDQQRFDTIQGLSNSTIRTPNLQKFMQDSVTFTNCFAQTAICAPSRGSFLTGRYAHCTGLRANGQRIRETERLVPRILADYDYACGLAGKLHLSPCLGGRLENRIDDGYSVFEWSHDYSDTWPGHNEWRNWLQRQNVKWPEMPKGVEAWGVPIDPKYTQTAWCADRAIAFLREQKQMGQWMFSVNIFQPHHPFNPTEEYLSHYKASDMPDPAYKQGELENKPKFQKVDHIGAYGGTGISFTKTSAQDHKEIIAAYYAMIEQVDFDFGRMMHALEESGQLEDTIVIFMSDHGEMLGDHGMYLKGPYFYDCLTRVPLIIRYPKKYKKGIKVDALVELIDLAPTLLETAGIPVPSRMQGKSMLPLCAGETTTHRDSVYMEFLDANLIYDPPPMCAAVRTDKWKVSLYSNLNTGELYDLEKDPGEFNNLWNVSAHKDKQAEMMTLLANRMILASDPYPERQTAW